MSRFRVANAMEPEVRQAFAERPHLVDRAPGFLGMEVFTDHRDPSVFYLVTRWTSAEAFHTWHRSEEHRASHAGIPKGLRLDASATHVFVLDRLASAPGPPSLDDAVADSTALVSGFLGATLTVHYIVATTEGVVLACNEAVALALGVPREQLTGSSLWRHLTAFDAEHLRARIAQDRRPQERFLLNFSSIAHVPYTLDCHLDVQPDGFVLLGEPAARDRPVQERLLELTNDYATLVRERSRLLAAERAARTEADLSNRLKDRFLATLGHELRSPLSAVVTAARVLEADPNLGPKAGRLCEIIRRQSEYLARLIDDLLDIARIAHDKLELRRAPTDLRDVVDRALEGQRHRVDAKRQRLTFHKPAAPAIVDGDPARLQQVVVNLVHNATKYTPDEGAIEVTLALEDSDVVLAVRDTGQGIPSDRLESVFDVFTQIDSASRQAEGGMGLGLALVRRLVTLHGGTIAAASDGADRGSTFTVRLPRLPGATRAAETTQVPARRTQRVLVVEDNDDLREVVASMLRIRGDEVVEAGTGEEAVAAAEHSRPELALIDLALPDIDGHEVARRLRARFDDAITLVALSGYGSAADRARTAAAGFQHHLLKPVTLEALEAVLGKGS